MSTIAVLWLVPLLLPAQSIADPAELLLQQARHKELIDGRLDEAAALYRKVAANGDAPPPVRARALAELGRCLEILAQPEARLIYQRILREFANQTQQAAFARARLAAIAARNAPAAEISSRRIWQTTAQRVLCVSPDGRWLALASASQGLQIGSLADGRVRALKTDPPIPAQFVAYAAFSSDGRQLALYISDGRRRILQVVALTGGVAKTLLSEAGNLALLGWSRDSKTIVSTEWQPNERAAQLTLISAADGSLQRISPPDLVANAAAFSPLGPVLAFQQSSDLHGPFDIFLWEGGNTKPVVQHPANDTLLGWTPDGRGIVFVSNRSGTNDVWMQRLKAAGLPEGDAVMIKRDIGAHRALGFSTRGGLFQLIAAGQNNLYTAAYDSAAGVIVPPPLAMATSFPLNTGAPGDAVLRWSPDGSMLMYLAKGDTKSGRSNGLIVKTLATGSETRVPVRRGLWFYQPEWSPDQTKFLVTGNDESGVPGIFVIDRQTGADRRIVDLASGAAALPGNGEWLADSRSFLYTIRDTAQPATFHLLRRDIETGEETRVRSGFLTNWMKLSPKWDRLAFTRALPGGRTTVIAVLPVDSASAALPGEIARTDRPAVPLGVAWSPDSKWVLFGLVNGGSSEIWRVAAASGGQPQKLASLDGQIFGLTTHPAGRQVGYTLGRRRFEVWVTENFLPLR